LLLKYARQIPDSGHRRQKFPFQAASADRHPALTRKAALLHLRIDLTDIAKEQAQQSIDDQNLEKHIDDDTVLWFYSLFDHMISKRITTQPTDSVGSVVPKIDRLPNPKQRRSAI
jgi:hypothetical protein